MIRALLEKLSKMVFLRFALFALCNFCVPSAANASQTITIQGRLTINHMGNATEIILPVASAQIEIYDEEIIQYPRDRVGSFALAGRAPRNRLHRQ